MAKFGTSSKNPGASSKSKPIYKTASCNLQAVLDASLYDPILAPLIEALKHHALFIPLAINTLNVLFSYLIKAHDIVEVDDNLDRFQLQPVNNDTVFHTKHIFLESIRLPRSATRSRCDTSSTAQVFRKILDIGHKPPLESTNNIKKSRLPITWNFVIHIIIRYLTGKTGGTD